MKYFQKGEFACNCGRCVNKINIPDFADLLDDARHRAGIPFLITSGYRCPTYNISVGGKPSSAHLKGLAADIATPTSRSRYKILWGLLTAGFDRIGIGPDFIHVDTDDSKSEEVAWDYYD
jgi:uncharacterized protein YcbK (DUF882 family)